MRILQINPVAGHSSTGRALSELDRYFTAAGHTCYAACIEGTDAHNLYRIGSAADRKLHALRSRLSGYDACYSRGATEKLLAQIDRIQPDVVKIGVVHSNFIDYFALMAYLAKRDIPVVLVLDDCWHYTGKCTHYTAAGCDRWQHGCGNCPRTEKCIPSWFFDRSAEMLQKKKLAAMQVPRLAVVGVSDWITNEAKQSILSSAKIIQRIYNWIDLAQFYPRENRDAVRKRYGVSAKFLILGVASSWAQGKGLEEFMRMAQTVDDRAEIVLVGDLPSAQTLPRRMRNVPRTNDTGELAELYSAADVFVTFSREESFGKVSAEALACGTPVVCYDSTASPELVGEGCGAAVPVGDFDGVFSAAMRICETGKAAYADACTAFAKENFALEKSARQYLELFEQLARM